MCIDFLSDIGHIPYRYLVENGRKRESFVERFCKITAAVALLAPGAILILGCFFAKALFSCCDSSKPKKIKVTRFPIVLGRAPSHPWAKKAEASFSLAPFQTSEITPEILKREFSLLRAQVKAFIASEKEMEKCLQNLEKPVFMQKLLDELDKRLIALNIGSANNLPYNKETWSQDLRDVVNLLVEVSDATDRFLISYEDKSAHIYRRPWAARQAFNRLHNAFCDEALTFWRQAKKLADLANHAQVSRLAGAKLGRWWKKYS